MTTILVLLLAQSLLVQQNRSGNPSITKAPIAASTGCNTTAPFTGSGNDSTHVVDGDVPPAQRNFDYFIPSGYDNTHPYCVGYVFTEAGGTPATAEVWAIHTAPGAAAACIWIFIANSTIGPCGTGWDDADTTPAAQAAYGCPACCYTAGTCHAKDVKLFDNAMAYIDSHFCTDTNRRFAAGFSWGGDFTAGLIVARGNKLRAASVASAGSDFQPGSPDGHWQSHLDYSAGSVSMPPPSVMFTYDASGGDSFYPAPDLATEAALFHNITGASTKGAPFGNCTEYLFGLARYIDCPVVILGHVVQAGWGTATWNFFSGF